jgi:hypothetical protein
LSAERRSGHDNTSTEQGHDADHPAARVRDKSIGSTEMSAKDRTGREPIT